MAIAEERTYATGRRKTAVARVWLQPGSGKFTINDRDDENYFERATGRMVIRQPLEETELLGKYDVLATVRGEAARPRPAPSATASRARSSRSTGRCGSS